MASFNGSVIGGSLNLRADPTTSAKKLASIPNGTDLLVFTVHGNTEWFSTSFGGHSGYVMSRYVAVTDDGGQCVVETQASPLNVRLVPAKDAAVLYGAPRHSVLRLLDMRDVADWYRVSGSEGTGWAASRYLRVEYPPVREDG